MDTKTTPDNNSSHEHDSGAHQYAKKHVPEVRVSYSRKNLPLSIEDAEVALDQLQIVYGSMQMQLSSRCNNPETDKGWLKRITTKMAYVKTEIEFLKWWLRRTRSQNGQPGDETSISAKPGMVEEEMREIEELEKYVRSEIYRINGDFVMLTPITIRDTQYSEIEASKAEVKRIIIELSELHTVLSERIAKSPILQKPRFNEKLRYLSKLIRKLDSNRSFLDAQSRLRTIAMQQVSPNFHQIRDLNPAFLTCKQWVDDEMKKAGLDNYEPRYDKDNPPDKNSLEDILARVDALRVLEGKIHSIRVESDKKNIEAFALGNKALKDARRSLSDLLSKVMKEKRCIRNYAIYHSMTGLMSSVEDGTMATVQSESMSQSKQAFDILKALLSVVEKLKKMRSVASSGHSKLTVDEIKIIESARVFVEKHMATVN